MASDPLSSAADQRRATRVGAPKVVVRIPSADRFRSHYLKDLSAGGLFVRADKVFAVGAELHIELWPPGETESLVLNAKVTRALAADAALSGQAAGMAVSFVGVTPELAERLRGLIEQYGEALVESPPPSAVDPLGQVQRLLADLALARGQVTALAAQLAEASRVAKTHAEQLRKLEGDEATARIAAKQQAEARAVLDQEVRKLRAEVAESKRKLEAERGGGELQALRTRVAQLSKDLEAARLRERELGEVLSGAPSSKPLANAKPAPRASPPKAPPPAPATATAFDPDLDEIIVEPGVTPPSQPPLSSGSPGESGSADEAFDVLLFGEAPTAGSAELPAAPEGDEPLLGSEMIDFGSFGASAPPAAAGEGEGDPLDTFLGDDEIVDVGGSGEESGGPAGFVLDASIVDGRVGYARFTKLLTLTTRLMPTPTLGSRKPASVDEALLGEFVSASPTFGTLLNQMGAQMKEERLKQLLYEMYARAFVDLRDF